MVEGLDSFREHFKDYADCYTVIGGAACGILMSEADIDFRATKDIDMILLLEGREEEFGVAFWDFIRAGEYKCGWKKNGSATLYRFTSSKKGFPIQIELFSRKPDYHLSVPQHIIPVYIGEEVSSLSAILLNDDFYRFMMDGRRVVDGVNILDVQHIIPFKMFAWNNLRDQKNRLEHVNERDYKKHKYDVFRLAEILPIGIKVPVEGFVKKNIETFLRYMVDEPVSLSQIGVSISKEQALELIRNTYRS